MKFDGSNLDYKPLYMSEAWGASGSFGIRIFVASGSPLPDLESEAITTAAYNSVHSLESAIRGEMLVQSEKGRKETEENRKCLTALFADPIWVDEIPNGYSSDWQFRTVPWFIVTTRIGRFKIGWRKRVIHLEWTETLCSTSAEDLFPGEDSTRYDRVIHAWTLEKAGEYIARIIQAGKGAQE